MFNINRDPKKSPVIMPEQLAPDLFRSERSDTIEETGVDQKVMDGFGAALFHGFKGFGNAG